MTITRTANSRLEKLMCAAEDATGMTTTAEYFHRSKEPSYFDGNILPRKLKDGGGDPDCPINNKLFGVYFYANNKIGSSLPTSSPFGSMQIAIPPRYFFRKPCNLYFADFFCTGRPHYVTLVMTKEGSDSDTFCKNSLIQLDVTNNNFLWVDDNNIKTTTGVWIEVFYTEEVDMEEAMDHGAKLLDVSTFGRGSSTRGGIPKDKDCTMCNVDNQDFRIKLPSRTSLLLTCEVVREIEDVNQLENSTSAEANDNSGVANDVDGGGKIECVTETDDRDTPTCDPPEADEGKSPAEGQGDENGNDQSGITKIGDDTNNYIAKPCDVDLPTCKVPLADNANSPTYHEYVDSENAPTKIDGDETKNVAKADDVKIPACKVLAPNDSERPSYEGNDKNINVTSDNHKAGNVNIISAADNKSPHYLELVDTENTTSNFGETDGQNNTYYVADPSKDFIPTYDGCKDALYDDTVDESPSNNIEEDERDDSDAYATADVGTDNGTNVWNISKTNNNHVSIDIVEACTNTTICETTDEGDSSIKRNLSPDGLPNLCSIVGKESGGKRKTSDIPDDAQFPSKLPKMN